jgi:hypothetical protein
MTDNAKNAERIAALEREVAALKAAVAPKPAESDWKPMSDAEHRDRLHQMRERQMSMATPPEVVLDWAVIPDHIVRGIALRDARAPQGPGTSIPSSQQVSNVRTGGRGSGWVDPTPLSNPPGTRLVDALCIADDVRQRAERKGKG